jgi:F-type H+-transporting ATPase subunit b
MPVFPTTALGEVAMHYFRADRFCLVLAGLALISFPAPGPAQKAEEKGHAVHKETKVMVKFFEKDREVEKPFDLSNEHDLDNLVELIRQGHVHSMILEKPPKIVDISWDLGLWTIVVFVLLYLILKKAAWGPILEGLQTREESIRRAVEEAKHARAETERVTAEFKVKMAEAYAEIPKLMDQARKDAQRLVEEMRAKAQADIQAERQRLRREIEVALEQALQQIYTQAAQLATLISAKAIQKSLSEEDHRRLVDQAMQELHPTRT